MIPIISVVLMAYAVFTTIMAVIGLKNTNADEEGAGWGFRVLAILSAVLFVSLGFSAADIRPPSTSASSAAVDAGASPPPCDARSLGVCPPVTCSCACIRERERAP